MRQRVIVVILSVNVILSICQHRILAIALGFKLRENSDDSIQITGWVGLHVVLSGRIVNFHLHTKNYNNSKLSTIANKISDIQSIQLCDMILSHFSVVSWLNATYIF